MQMHTRMVPAAAALTGVVLLVFLPVFGHEFLEWDDGFNVVENPALHPVSLAGLRDVWTNPARYHMYPLTQTLWALTALAARGRAGPLDPRPFHTANVLLHILAALAVFRTIRLLLPALTRTGPETEMAAAHGRTSTAPAHGAAGILPAAAGAALFAVHPVQVEPVAWVTGAKDVLSGLLALVALWQFARLCVPAATPRPARTLLHGLAASLAFALAILAKPTAALSAPLALVVAAGTATRARTHAAPAAARFLLPLLWLLAAAPWLWLTKHTQRDEILQVIAPIHTRPMVALDAIAFYVYKLCLPFRLGPDYGRTPLLVLGQAWRLLTWTVPVGLALCALGLGARRLVGAALAVFVAALAPVLGLTAFAHQAISTVADRYLYVAMLGPALGFAAVLAAQPAGRRRAALAAVLCLLGVRAHLQSRHWHDTASLFRHALDVNPRSALSNYNLGLVAANAGQAPAAVAHYLEAIRIEPAHYRAHNNLGSVLARTGRAAEAIAQFSTALDIYPGFAGASYNLGCAFETQGRTEEALALYSRALEQDSRFTDAHAKLALALFRAGRVDRALFHARRAVDTSPRDKYARNDLATMLLRQGQRDAALAQYSAALAIDPDYPEAHYNMGIACLEASRRDRAEWHFRQALRIRPDMKEAAAYLDRMR